MKLIKTDEKAIFLQKMGFFPKINKSIREESPINLYIFIF